MPEAEHPAVVRALGIDPLAAEIRQVYFFDTPDLTLNDHGVVVRARRVQRKGGDSVVKLRPVVPADLPGSLRKASGFTVGGGRDAGRVRLLRHAQAKRGRG